MKDKYSRTIEAEEGVVVHATEYIEKKLLVNVAYIEDSTMASKGIMLTEDEAIVLNSILNDWTKQRIH